MIRPRRALAPLALIGLIGLGLPGPAAAAPPTEEERTEAFAEFTENITSGQKARAADALVSLVRDPERSAFHADAYAMLADLLVTLDLKYSALSAYKASMQTAAADKAADEEAEGVDPEVAVKALDLAAEVGDEALLEEVFADNVGLEVGDDAKSRLAWLAARENFRRGQLSVASGVLSMVSKDAPVFARAQLLKGIISSQQGTPTQALAPLLTAAALAEQQGDEALLVMANLNLGRAYYAAENYPKAIEYYAKVPRSSHWWPEAQFERSWAHFQLTDMNGTLALLQNHTSPFFEDWYFPEGEMLRIYALFLLCKFPTATEGIKDFQARWRPIHQETAPLIAGMSDVDVFEDARAYAAGEAHRLPSTFLRDYPHEEAFLATIRAVEAAEEELTRLQGVSANPFSSLLNEWIVERKAAMIASEGARIKGRIESQLAIVLDMSDSSDVLLLDMTRLERMLYEQAAGTGVMAEAPQQADRDARLRRGFVSWPYEGEYWGDELGWYRVDAKSECPAGMR